MRWSEEVIPREVAERHDVFYPALRGEVATSAPVANAWRGMDMAVKMALLSNLLLVAVPVATLEAALATLSPRIV